MLLLRMQVIGHPRPRGPTTAYVALGSNLGDRVGWIEKACREMDARGIRVKRTSSLWETEPMYVLEQDRFVNGACEVETTLEPLALLDALQDIERTLGREKLIDKGPRNIDLDILMYGNETIDHERLKVPHIGIPEREFVLRPLAELIPGKPIYPSNPWKLTLDYLHELPPNPKPLSPLTPICSAPSVSAANTITALTPTRKTHVMAIVNITPDSFSDGGVHTSSSLPETLLAAVRAGATMIDVGGQSSAPGRPEVSVEEELSRVVPTIHLIRSVPELRSIPISVDTYRAAVAEAAVAAGADFVNDISAGLLDPDMLPTVARLGVTVCLMHMRGTPQTMSSLNEYPSEEGGIVATIAKELLQRVAAAEAAGIRRWRIVLDPGLGFAKVGEQNLEVLSGLEELRSWPGLEGLPWLVGSSRKSFIGRITGVPKPEERIWGTAATVAAAVAGGADVVRVHDAVEMCQVVRMSDAIWRRR
ncbi:Dihydropteroate synthase-like protein [Plectosphaerella cucumerina]|uniref:Folic acid synthesis protein FOL1 n=1 Tax=Plectosphaerella cucumerina TaxID=40658 RepID=A0A8K0TMS6_9PEZI|nr:Dihydropteroate synthase-like protein [Plectosphaerella cucumerina]